LTRRQRIQRAVMPRRPRLLRCCALLACLSGMIPAAWAQTDEIQVYDAEITAPGGFNLTWHNNYTFAGRTQPAFPGGVVPEHALNGVPEWAYGVTKWFEAGIYLPVYTLTSDGQLLFDSTKLRLLFVAPDAHNRTLFYGINFEFSYNKPQWEPYRWSGEIRPIVGVHLGRLDLIANPILDTDFNGLGRLDFAPCARAAWNFSDRLAMALENYSDLGPVRHFASGPNQSHTLFAVLDLGNSSNGIEFGVGHGFTHASDSGVVKLMVMHDL
jgi:hypothetical protein